ncbi:MAG TPA: chloride channel protein [Terriglobales bacterium]|nr:chloride channel protein [Terriglobales bacterium]
MPKSRTPPRRRRRWWWPRFLSPREFGEALSPHTIMLSLHALVVGVASGFVALGLLDLIYRLTGLFFHGVWSGAQWNPTGGHLGWWVILIPVIGGLPVGLMVYFWEPTLKGHGTPEAMEAVLIGKSKVRSRVAILKPLATALAIGTGGPFGAEGPIIQTGAAVGSLFAQWRRLSVYDRRVLLAAGAGAGMAATFKAPLAGVMVAVELVVFEFRARSFIPIAFACVAADAVAVHYRGAGPMFPMPLYLLHSMGELVLFAVLGAICGLVGWAMTKSLAWIDNSFDKLPFKPVAIWGPTVGALMLGVIGFFFPQVFGTGYATIREILNQPPQHALGAGAMLRLSISKFWALVISLGSGTTGGVFAPSLVVGGGVGAAFALGWHALFPAITISPPGFYALCAMAAVFGSIARAPFTAVIFLFELSRDPAAVLPLLVCVMVADGLMRLVSADSMMTEKLAKRGLIVSQDYIAPQLELWSTEIHELLKPSAPGQPDASAVMKSGKFIKVHPGDSVAVTAHAMIQDHADWAVVMNTAAPPHPLGVVSIGDILSLEDEALRVRDARQRERA